MQFSICNLILLKITHRLLRYCSMKVKLESVCQNLFDLFFLCSFVFYKPICFFFKQPDGNIKLHFTYNIELKVQQTAFTYPIILVTDNKVLTFNKHFKCYLSLVLLYYFIFKAQCCITSVHFLLSFCNFLSLLIYSKLHQSIRNMIRCFQY